MATVLRVPQLHSEEYRRQLHRDLRLIRILAVVISLAAFVFYFETRQILLFGDAVAHIHIARRVFDSMTPGFSNLGTVWLPAPHILSIPFLVNEWMWRTGAGGSIVSMVSYFAACVGMFRMFRQFGRRSGAWMATAVFALNANVLYVQSTAMSELLYLAALIWSVESAAEFLNQLWTLPLDMKRIRWISLKGSLALFVAMLTRYDGWFQTAATVVIVSLLVLTGSGRIATGLTLKKTFQSTWPAWIILAAAPALWIGYNARVFHNPLEFWNGPYSARAIDKKSAKPGGLHPGDHNLHDAFIYFEKCAKEDISQGAIGSLLLVLSLFGIGFAAFRGRAAWVVLLLWVPLLFYTMSIAYGGVPIFMPFWRPWGYYNVRYGMQLLPAFAVGIGLFVQWVSFLLPQRRRPAFIYACIAIAALITVREWKLVPFTLQEARYNARTRMLFEGKLAEALEPFKGERMLMYTADYAGALQRAAIPERTVINESNWTLWSQALQSPADHASIVVAVGQDPVAQAIEAHPEDLEQIAVIQSEEKPRTTVYRSLVYGTGAAQ